MSAVPKHARLLKALITSSSENKIDWKTASAPEAYKAVFKNSSVIFAREVGDDFVSKYVITILNNRGESVDIFSDEDLTGLLSSPYNKMRELHNEIKRKISGADQLLDEIITQIEDDIPF